MKPHRLSTLPAALAVALLCHAAVQKSPGSPAKSDPIRDFHSSPASQAAHSTLNFEPNHGQTDPQVRYMARRGMTRVFLTDHGAVLETAKVPMMNEIRGALGSIDSAEVENRSRNHLHESGWRPQTF